MPNDIDLKKEIRSFFDYYYAIGFKADEIAAQFRKHKKSLVQAILNELIDEGFIVFESFMYWKSR